MLRIETSSAIASFHIRTAVCFNPVQEPKPHCVPLLRHRLIRCAGLRERLVSFALDRVMADLVCIEDEPGPWPPSLGDLRAACMSAGSDLRDCEEGLLELGRITCTGAWGFADGRSILPLG
ncbi:hypothetical protein N8I77_001953 [Diaporthe amygdali]|uniref:Uncharacterized protein n=1 Tax=Phomopsis amygdali TaxID=1214568 RepID=A0AAD9WAN7_PHOAM|nr:hypothetical protein N8I77_001953 [Diaporthe amygdali]